jgi:hypothetical protein
MAGECWDRLQAVLSRGSRREVAAVNGEAKITASHRSRIAAVYIRQSTMVQVRDHTESTTRQYALAGDRSGWVGRPKATR